MNARFNNFICPQMQQSQMKEDISYTSSSEEEMTLKSIVRDHNSTSEVRAFFRDWIKKIDKKQDDDLFSSSS